jgi:hypothetical protein
MSEYATTVNVFAGILSNTNSLNDLEASIATGNYLSALSDTGSFIATIASVAELPVTAIVAGSDAAALNFVELGVVLARGGWPNSDTGISGISA